ncbi:MAG: GAF domain-containing protein [Sphingomonas phyllosphaerae]
MRGSTKLPTLATDADAGAFMRARVERGSDYIKVVQDDGARRGEPADMPSFTPTRFAEVIAAAKATGKLVVVHVQKLAVARIAVANGVNALEHAVCDEPVDDALIAAMKAHGTIQTATLATYAGLAGTDDARQLAADPAVAPFLSPLQKGMLTLDWQHPRPVDYAQDLREGRTVVIPDIRLDPRTSGDTAPLNPVAVRSLVNRPVREKGRTVTILYVNDGAPRDWTPEEVQFIADAGNRTWTALERRRAEKEAKETAAFLSSVLAASTDCIKVVELDGRLSFMTDGGMKVMEISDFNAVRGCLWPNFLKEDGPAYGSGAYQRSVCGLVARPNGENGFVITFVQCWKNISKVPNIGPA